MAKKTKSMLADEIIKDIDSLLKTKPELKIGTAREFERPKRSLMKLPKIKLKKISEVLK